MSAELFGSDSEDESIDDIPGLIVLRKEITPMNIPDDWFSPSEGINQRMEFGTLSFPQLEMIARNNFPAHLLRFLRLIRDPLFDQSIANYYSPGEGIVHHIDLHRFCDGILIANLRGTCIIEFKKHPRKLKLFLEPGDVLLLHGQARWEWTHGIPERDFDVIDGVFIKRTERISLTLRKMRP
jgi:hypothetical protein